MGDTLRVTADTRVNNNNNNNMYEEVAKLSSKNEKDVPRNPKNGFARYLTCRRRRYYPMARTTKQLGRLR